MNNTLAIAQREITDRRFVFIVAVAFLLLALVVPFMPGVHAGDRAGALVIGALVLATSLTLGLAAILGSSIVGREMSDGRLSFYFSKPVAATSIWWGKLIAAFALILACFIIVAIPAFVVGSTTAVRRWVNTPEEMLTTAGIVIGAAVALFLTAHVLGTFVRSRSVWFLFDFVAASVCGTAIWMMGRILLLGYAFELVKTLAIAFAVFAALAVIAAGAWQIARGRTDRRRSHMELSRFLWTAIGLGLLVVSAYVMWIVSVTVSGMTQVSFVQASNGPWSMLNGRAKARSDYHATFLYNISDGRLIRTANLIPMWPIPRFSSNGKFVAWFGKDGLYVTDLDKPKPESILTRIQSGWLEALSDDGSRAAVMENFTMTVYDLRSQSSLGSVRLPPLWMLDVRFVTPEVVRIYAKGAILEYDLRRKTLEKTGSVPETVRINADATRGLVLPAGPAEVRDGRTGAVIATIMPHPASVGFLRDGRIVAVENRGNASVLRVLTRDGSPIREIALPAAAGRWRPIAESSDGIVSILLGQHIVAVDVNGGVLRQDGLMVCPTSSAGPSLLCRSPEGPVVWNPLTGQKRPVT
jgi:ABC-type transport system involved in multi-copper enzyme maturation permease subunit